MTTDNPIVVAEAVRSAVGRAHKGSLALKRPDELGGDVFGLTFEERIAEVSEDQAAHIQELVERRTALRGEKKFSGVEELAKQIEIDARQARALLGV